MHLTRAHAYELLAEGSRLNPGPWMQHSQTTALCAQRIAAQCGMDEEKAYVFGLLHDIRRRYGVSHLKHTIDGYHYLQSLACPAAARICLTHSFPTKAMEDYCGNYDVTPLELQEIKHNLQIIAFDDYDRLIQLCDALSGSQVMDMHARIADVEKRYGYYSPAKRSAAEHLKAYFEERCGENIYRIVTEDETLWGV